MELSEQHRQKLDGIVAKMEANGEPEENIRFVVSDFKQKYSGSQPSGDLLAQHNANLRAGEEAYQPSWSESYKTGGLFGAGGVGDELVRDLGSAITETPKRLAAIPGMLWQGMTRPAELGVNILEHSTDPLISPRSTGKALMAAGTDTMIGGAVGKLVSMRAARNASLEGAVTPKIKSELTRGIKPINRKTEFGRTLENTVPEVAESSSALNRPIKGIEDVEALVPHAKKRIWAEYDAKLGPNAQSTIDGNPIADAMESTITKRFEMQNPAKAERIREIASTYRREIPLSEAEDFLQDANNELHAFYAKNKVGRDVASRDPEWGHVVKEAEELRKQLYSKLDQVAGPDAAALKRTYGELTSLQEEVLRRKNVAARQNPTSLAEQISFAQSAGRALRAAANLNLGDAASAIAQPLAARYLKNRNTTDALIERGFGRYRPKKSLAPSGDLGNSSLPRGTQNEPPPIQSATVVEAPAEAGRGIDAGTGASNQGVRGTYVPAIQEAETPTAVQATNASQKLKRAPKPVDPIKEEAMGYIDDLAQKYGRKGAIPTKDRAIIYENYEEVGPGRVEGTGKGRRVWEGMNIDDIPILQDVPHSKSAIENALATRRGKVWDRIMKEAEEYVKRNKEAAEDSEDIPF